MNVKTMLKLQSLLIVLIFLSIVATTPCNAMIAPEEVESENILMYNNSINASTEPYFFLAPANPAFIKYQEELQQNQERTGINNEQFNDAALNVFLPVYNTENYFYPGSELLFSGDMEMSENLLHPPGLRPSPVDLSYLSPVNMEQLLADEAYSDMPSVMTNTITSGAYPSRYDLREEGGITGIRNQAFAGTCWVHSSLASLESYLMHSRSENWDFSENHVKNTLVSSYQNGFDRTFHYDGGLDLMTVAYLTRWDGPVTEPDDPYDDLSPISSSDVTVAKHVQQVIMLPGLNHSDSLFKWAIMNYGAISVAMHDDNSLYFNKENNSYYCYNENAELTHAVSMAGWDDNFDRNKFTPAAPGNGAYIIKNSWGDNWGDDGYYYISYYDTVIGKDVYARDTGRAYTTNFVITAGNVSNYDRIYQYDPLGWCASIGDNNNTAIGANIFTAVSNERLEAVSFYTVDSNSLYNISVYLNPEGGPVSTSGPVSVKNGSIPIAGYHTIELDDHVSLLPGQNFSVIITFTTPAYTYPLAVEKAVHDYSSNAHAEAGQSYASSNGNSWIDISAHGMNVCIKAFTSEEKEPEAGFVASRRYVHVNETIDFHDASLFSPQSWHWDFGDGSTAEVQNPSHSYTNPGIYNATLTTSNEFGSNVTQRTSFIHVLNSTIIVNNCGTADFMHIQDAIWAASEGDTIIVEPGTYTEMIRFRKDNITLRSSTGNPADVRVTSSHLDLTNQLNFAVSMIADNITLQGVSFSGRFYGMLTMLSNDCTVIDCSFSDNGYGIQFSESDNNRMYNSTIKNNFIGLALGNSASNYLANNSVSDNSLYSCVFDSQPNFIDTSNTVDGKPIYYLVGISDLTIDSGSNAGLVHLIDCSNITIKDFESTSERYGIYLYNTTNSMIENCSSTGDYYGIYLTDSADNIIKNCTVSNTKVYGISLTECSDNLIYNNYFNNTHNIQVSGGLSNEWNITMTPGTNIINGSYLGGNFWAKPGGNGWSQVNPSTGNGFCQQYTVTDDGNNIDILPLTINGELSADDGNSDLANGNGQNQDKGTIIYRGSRDGLPENAVSTDSNMQFVSRDAEVRYVFAKEGNPITHIRFEAQTNKGYVVADVSRLKGIPEDAHGEPSGLIYENLEITLGDERLSSSNFIAEAFIGFEVPMEWIESNNIDEDSIRLEHYSNGKWNRLPTVKVSEDSEKLFFEARTTGFSPFAISGDRIQAQGYEALGKTSAYESGHQIQNGNTKADGTDDSGKSNNMILLLLSTPIVTIASMFAYYKHKNSKMRMRK
jgi:PGF-pre-PGF domain-containing protein